MERLATQCPTPELICNILLPRPPLRINHQSIPIQPLWERNLNLSNKTSRQSYPVRLSLIDFEALFNQSLDGFGSSASDPVLQAKYGHIKEVINIAPPPIINAPSPIQYSAFNSGSNTVYNRYVPYEINASSAPPQSYPQYTPTTMPGHQALQQSSVPPPVPQGVSQAPSQQTPLLSQPVPPPPVLTSSSSFGSNFITPAVVQTNFPMAPSSREAKPTPSQSTPDNILVQVDLSSPEPKMTAQRSSSFEAEEQVISSSSSSVL